MALKDRLIIIGIIFSLIHAKSWAGNSDEIDRKAVEITVENIAQKNFSMSSSQLPKEILVGILVKLSPVELSTAAHVCKQWQEVAVEIMKGNLAKWKITSPASDAELIHNYTILAYARLCPRLENEEIEKKFLQSLKNTKLDTKAHYIKFELENKIWHLLPKLYEIFDVNIAMESGEGHISTVGKVIDIKFSKIELEKNPSRVRCYYEAFLGPKISGSKKFDFRFTTFINE